jgi:hypothetical protein
LLDDYGPSELVTMAEAMRLTNSGRHVLRWAVSNGDLPVVRLSPRTIRFKAGDLQRLVAFRTYGRSVAPLRKRA